MLFRNHKKAFTLIELLVVIVIIGILSTLAMLSLNSARVKARDAKRMSDIKQVASALDLYYADNNTYPTIITPGQPITSPDGTKLYMAKVPSNPTPRNDGVCNTNDYSYSVDDESNPTVYDVSTCLGSDGTSAYSQVGWFHCGQKIHDADNNQYDTVQIGSQCWMAQNLNVGTMIGSKLADNTTLQNQTDNSTIEKYCYGYVDQDDNDQINTGTTNCNTYGGLYQWAEAIQYKNGATNTSDWSEAPTGNIKGLCPNGWHIPTFIEYQILAQNADPDCVLGNSCNTAGGKLKAKSDYQPIAWDGDNIGNFNFNAIPSARRLPDGSFTTDPAFFIFGNSAVFWTATPNLSSPSFASFLGLNTLRGMAFGNNDDRSFGFSIRCLKN